MVELGVQGSSHSLLGCKLLEDRDSSSMCLQPAHGAWGQALVTAQDEVSVDLFFFFLSHRIPPFSGSSIVSHFRTRNCQYWGREEMILNTQER